MRENDFTEKRSLKYIITESDGSDSMASECPFIVIDELDDYDDEDDFIKKPRTEIFNATHQTSVNNVQNGNFQEIDFTEKNNNTTNNTDSESEDSDVDDIQKVMNEGEVKEEDVVFIDVKGSD